MYLKSCLFGTLLIIASSQCRHLEENVNGGNFSSSISREFAQDFCRNNGTEGTAEEFWVHLDKTMTCVLQVYNSSTALDKTPFDLVLDNYCGKLDDVKSCVYPLLETAISCVASTGRNATSSERRELDAIIDFTCRKDGEEYKIIHMFSNGRDCLIEKYLQLMSCLPDDDDASSESYKEECADFLTLEQCVLPVLKSCKDPAAGQYYEEFFEEMKRVLSCQPIELDIDNKLSETAAEE